MPGSECVRLLFSLAGHVLPLDEDLLLAVQQDVPELVHQAEPEDVVPPVPDAHLDNGFLIVDPSGRTVRAGPSQVWHQNKRHSETG